MQWVRRTVVMLAAAAVTLAPAAALGYDDPYVEPGPPPYDTHTVIIRFSWPRPEDIRLHYALLPGDEDPATSGYKAAAWWAGCEEGSYDPEPAAPLIADAGGEFSRNLVGRPGTYWLVARTNQFCTYFDDPDRVNRTAADFPDGSEIVVTATVETYAPGETAPVVETLTASLPVYRFPDDMLAIRRVLGSITVAGGEPTATSSTTSAPTDTTSNTTEEPGTTGATTTTRAGTTRDTPVDDSSSGAGTVVAVAAAVVVLGAAVWVWSRRPPGKTGGGRAGKQQQAPPPPPPPPPPQPPPPEPPDAP
jgi:hypothetical protein